MLRNKSALVGNDTWYILGKSLPDVDFLVEHQVTEHLTIGPSKLEERLVLVVVF